MQLDFLLALFRPLLEPQEAAWLMGECSDDRIRGLIDEGILRAVDIASRRADQPKQRCLRIYRYTVEHLLIAPKAPVALVPVEQILLHSRPLFLKSEVARTLACTERHVANLDLPSPPVSQMSLTRLPRYTREGLIQFLTAREIRP